MRSLGIKSKEGWDEYVRSGDRPDDVPRSPHAVYRDQWRGYGDWLGKGRLRRAAMRPFGDVKEIARSLGIKTKGEWEEYVKSGNKPEDIPAIPQQTYREEWRGWPAFLGTETRPFEASREFARSLGLKTQAEWVKYCKSGDKPEDIPSTPQEVHKNQWRGWRDWLGTETLPFTEAREFVHSLGIQNAREWLEYCKSGDKPRNVPAKPNEKYKGEWCGWGDWLGTGRIAKGSEQWRDFEPAREFARSLGLLSSREWVKYGKSGDKPEDIPAHPDTIYEDQWRGYGDWLGISGTIWTRRALLAFLEDLRPRLGDLEETELYLILQQGGAMPGLRKALGQTTVLGVLKDLRENDARGVEEALQAAAERDVLEGYTNEDVLEDHAPEMAEDPELHAEILEGGGLASLAAPDALRFVDDFADLHYGLDDETAQYLVDNRVAALWEAYTNTGAETLETLEGEGGYYFELIRDRFKAELEGALNLPTPAGWSFRPPGMEDGPPVEPNLMQRRTAHALATRKRLGNWSGVGSGKTLSGILASRVTDRLHTLVICNNATVAGWLREIRNAFPDSVARSSVGRPVIGARLYTVLNYEKFQQANRRALVEDLVALEVDAVILDEVQFVKQRDSKVSARREAVHALLSELETRNPDLHVLGMSATPVINTLMEARRLVEIVTGRAFPDLAAQATVNNALAMHRTLMIHGLRYRPRYDIETTTETPTVTRNDLADDLKAGEGVLHLERTLLPAKLETVREHIRPGTLLYTHYVDGMVDPIRAHVEGLGYRVGLYTGADKTGLEDFLAGQVDVLIGSKPVGTGLDGLQRVCNQVLMLSLPWTSAEYEQIIGRVRRQGAAFGSVRMVIPQVKLENDGDTWSWDARRMDTIRFKRTLSDCALDGNIPEVARINPKELETRGREALEAWITRVRDGAAAVGVERPKLRIPLPPEVTGRLKVERGDFAALNNRWTSANSETVHACLKDSPEEWYLYHTLYREARAQWPEVPALRIAEDLKRREDLRVGDFGAGECLLRDTLPSHDVVSIDHVAIDPGVIACDMARTPLEDGELGAAVFSLSLMGRNWKDYLAEARRTLRPFGLVFIAEPARRWKVGALEDALEGAGFDPLRTIRRGDFIYARGVKY